MEFLWPGMRRENSTGVFDSHVYMYVKGRHFIAMRRQAGQPATGRDAGKPGEKLLSTRSPIPLLQTTENRTVRFQCALHALSHARIFLASISPKTMRFKSQRILSTLFHSMRQEFRTLLNCGQPDS